MSVIIVSIILVSVAVVLLSVKIIFQDKGQFPETHVGGNKAMQERKISCHTSQHNETNSKLNLAERIKARQSK